MYRTDILEDCLMELPPFGNFPMWSFSDKTREQVTLLDVQFCCGVYSARASNVPVGGIFTVEYSDGSKREVFVGGIPAKRYYKSSLFLRAGRKGNLLTDIRDLIINDARDAVPDYLKDALCDYGTACDQSAS